MVNRKARTEDADLAILEVVALHREIIQDPKIGQRAVAIRQALANGATLRELGHALGVSPETVRKYQRMA